MLLSDRSSALGDVPKHALEKVGSGSPWAARRKPRLEGRLTMLPASSDAVLSVYNNLLAIDGDIQPSMDAPTASRQDARWSTVRVEMWKGLAYRCVMCVDGACMRMCDVCGLGMCTDV
eukprot:364197-Chlamydomonas_euryale.AAC.40